LIEQTDSSSVTSTYERLFVLDPTPPRVTFTQIIDGQEIFGAWDFYAITADEDVVRSELAVYLSSTPAATQGGLVVTPPPSAIRNSFSRLTLRSLSAIWRRQKLNGNAGANRRGSRWQPDSRRFSLGPEKSLL